MTATEGPLTGGPVRCLQWHHTATQKRDYQAPDVFKDSYWRQFAMKGFPQSKTIQENTTYCLKLWNNLIVQIPINIIQPLLQPLSWGNPTEKVHSCMGLKGWQAFPHNFPPNAINWFYSCGSRPIQKSEYWWVAPREDMWLELVDKGDQELSHHVLLAAQKHTWDPGVLGCDPRGILGARK